MARPAAVFYYELASPECYLAAEAIALGRLPIVPEWEPVMPPRGRPRPDRGELERREELERRAVALGLLPLRWPRQWPADGRTAMLAATYAKQTGRAVAFSLAAFRQAFAGGRDIDDPDTVLIAAAACELHPTAVLRALRLRSVARALERAGERAAAAGVTTLPAVALDGRVLIGLAEIDCAVGALRP